MHPRSNPDQTPSSFLEDVVPHPGVPHLPLRRIFNTCPGIDTREQGLATSPLTDGKRDMIIHDYIATQFKLARWASTRP
jgi:hypothetical protein